MAVFTDSTKTKIKVQKGDNLTKIKNWLGTQGITTSVSELVKLNNIKNPDLIYINQILKISGTASTVAKTKTSRAEIDAFGLQAESDRLVFATWNWDKPSSETENYKVMWQYDTGDGVWFVGNDGTEEYKQSTYTAPSNAKRVRFKVKPISKKKTVNKKETTYWTASWSTYKTYKFSEAEEDLTKPSTPSVEVEGLKLVAEIDNYSDTNATHIQFQIVQNNTKLFKTINSSLKTSHAAVSCSLTAGYEYKVRCRAYKGKKYSEWSDYSDNKGTRPNAPKAIEKIRAKSATEVGLDWTHVSNAKTYEIQYTTNKTYFDRSDQVQNGPTVDASIYSSGYVSGLESGTEYFFRVRAVNDYGESGWTPIKSIIIGEKPVAPTTWSSTTTVETGKDIVFYWVHNTNDGSYQRLAQIEVTVDGETTIHDYEYTPNEDKDEPTYSKTFSTSSYAEGAKIKWRVRTAGITEAYGPWSTQRTVEVVAPPTLELSLHDADGNSKTNIYEIMYDSDSDLYLVTDNTILSMNGTIVKDAISTEGDDVYIGTNSDGEQVYYCVRINEISNYPFYITALPGPDTQNALGYHISISANEAYDTVDSVGNKKLIKKGEVVYSQYFDTRTFNNRRFSASDVDLENNVEYTLTCVVSMSSGLTATDSVVFTMSLSGEMYEPNADIFFNDDNYSMSIRPYCENEDGVLIGNIWLSVYRREFDGKFTEIGSDLNNTRRTFVTDLHPSLDYARYRIVAESKTTGAISFYDVPAEPINCPAVIIQWAEEWTEFDTDSEDELEQPPWTGSLLYLPYNIDVSNDNKIDVSLINYIGREHPTSYYGTHLGETATWNVEIPKDDKETLYSLRRLAIWMGDVYVREPSGSGYWANISVSFSQKHCELTIPVTLTITRVEGGA